MKRETKNEEAVALSPCLSRMRACDRMQIPGSTHPSQCLNLPGIFRSYRPVIIGFPEGQGVPTKSFTPTVSSMKQD